MIYGLYHSAAGMLTNEYRQNVITNNLANAETIGFKQQIPVFAEREPAAVAGWRTGPTDASLAGLSGGLWLGRTHTDFSPGNFVATGNGCDVALDGPGFLVVEVHGRPQYTRDGRLMKDADGLLRAAADGAPVLGAGGAPIRMNPWGGQPTLDEDGQVWQDGVPVGQLAVVDFADRRVLQPAGGSRFDAGDAATVPAPARVVSGHLEASGVEPVRELVQMIEANRAYQFNAQMISLQDQTIGRLITVIAR